MWSWIFLVVGVIDVVSLGLFMDFFEIFRSCVFSLQVLRHFSTDRRQVII